MCISYPETNFITEDKRGDLFSVQLQQMIDMLITAVDMGPKVLSPLLVGVVTGANVSDLLG